jgi:hypothetical protein
MNESWGHLAGRRYGGRIQLHSNRKRSGGLAEHKMAPVPVPPLPLTCLLPIAWSSLESRNSSAQPERLLPSNAKHHLLSVPTLSSSKGNTEVKISSHHLSILSGNCSIRGRATENILTVSYTSVVHSNRGCKPASMHAGRQPAGHPCHGLICN